MHNFGIRFDSDTFFIGTRRKWWGIHIDAPWSEDVREYGCPFGIYVHMYPWHWRHIFRFRGKHQRAFEERCKDAKGVRSVGIGLRCAVEGCGWEGEPGTGRHGSLWVTTELHKRDGSERSGNSHSFTLCPDHVEMADAAGRYEDHPQRKPWEAAADKDLTVKVIEVHRKR